MGADSSAEIEAVPYWLRAIAFEQPDSTPGKAVSAPSRSARLAPWRSLVLSRPGPQFKRGIHPATRPAGKEAFVLRAGAKFTETLTPYTMFAT